MGKFTLHSSVSGKDTATTVDLDDMELDDVCEDLEVLLIHFAHNIETGGDLGKSNKELATVVMNALKYCRDFGDLIQVCQECVLDDDACFPVSPDARVH